MVSRELQAEDRCWWLRNFGVAELKLRLALSMESKSVGFSLVFLRFWQRRKSGLAEFKLRLALSMESKSDGFP